MSPILLESRLYVIYPQLHRPGDGNVNGVEESSSGEKRGGTENEKNNACKVLWFGVLWAEL